MPIANLLKVDEQPPPFLGRWGRLYAIVLVELAVLIALLYLFTKVFTY